MLHHIAIEVRPEDAAGDGRFWQAAGFRPVRAPEAPGSGYEWFEHGGTQIHLIRVRDPVVPEKGHAAVVVPGFEAALRRIRDLGIEVTESRQLWGERRAKAVLPSGHTVELMAALPPAG